MSKTTGAAAIALAALSLSAAHPLAAGNQTVPGEVTTPYPTIVNLAVDWKIEGDDNQNGRVEVEYRRAGEKAWHRAMPLRRVPAGKSAGTTPIFEWSNRHSGSIFDLQPDTEYEIRLKLSDPDGGEAEKTVRARTRPVPRAASKARTRRAAPETLAALAEAAEPGDILLLAPGGYGAFTVKRDGAPARPLVFRSEKPAAAVFDRFDMKDRKYVHLEGAAVNGSVDLLGGEGLVVRRCVIKAEYGVIAKRPPGTRNAYIADNVITGNMPWDRNRMGASAPPGFETCTGEGVQITGPGNVVCYNRVRGYRDCISFMEDRGTGEQVSIDVYNNDVTLGIDDAIEGDFAMSNCRIVRNRITNCFMGLSSQPGLGGPTYFIRNVMYNITNSALKLSRRSSGDVVLHNTVIKVGDGWNAPHRDWSHALLRNNLAIGGSGGGMFGRYPSGPGLAIALAGPDETCDMDYDGVGTSGTPWRGRIHNVTFDSLAEWRERTSYKHGVQVDMSVFDKVPFPDPAIPERPIPDLRIRAGSAAEDAGLALPNINDGFRGKAPDLGAYEAGQELPHYGPRPAGLDEETAFRKQKTSK
jgi:hypothetical protein